MRFVLTALLGMAVLLAATGCEDSSLGPAQRGSIDGRVQDFESDAALSGVNITTSPPTSALVTDSEGRFSLDNVEVGNYTISARKSGYDPNQVTVAVRADETTQATIFLEPGGESSATDDTIGVSVTNWANRPLQPDSVFVDVEYRVHNVGETDIDAYEVYFRIQTSGDAFYYEAQGDSLAAGQADVASFSKYVRDQSATDVTVDDYWLP
jgi:hypothetical protein